MLQLSVIEGDISDNHLTKSISKINMLCLEYFWLHTLQKAPLMSVPLSNYFLNNFCVK